MEWEVIDEDTSRSRIPGGWLVKQWCENTLYIGDDKNTINIESIAFVPDPKGEWIIDKE